MDLFLVALVSGICCFFGGFWLARWSTKIRCRWYFYRGTAHLGCLEKALGRQLTVEDFDLSAPLNAGIGFGLRLAERQ